MVEVGRFEHGVVVDPTPAAVYWNQRLQSYCATLAVAELDPSQWATVGGRFAECVTIDAVINQLLRRGLGVTEASVPDVVDLANDVRDQHGDAEVVGLSDELGTRRLVLVTASRVALPVRPSVEHPDYRIWWGDTSPASVETARLVLDRVWVGHYSVGDGDAYALAGSHLYDQGPLWSMSATSLCDWVLQDATPTTALTPEDLAAFRGLVGRPQVERSQRRGLQR